MAAPIIDYASNLDTKNDEARATAYRKMTQHFGYLPVYGPTMIDVETGQKLLKYLTEEFPGYKWVIEVRDTIVSVINETLDPNWGFRVREGLLDSEGKIIRLMAGELLERFGVVRGKANKDELNEVPRDARGNIKRIL